MNPKTRIEINIEVGPSKVPGSRNLKLMQLWLPVKGLAGYRKRRCLAQGN